VCYQETSRFQLTQFRGSQEERISILKMALTEKGIVTSGAHYDIKESEMAPKASPVAEPETTADNGEDGVYL